MNPAFVAVNPVTNKVYVANSNSKSVTVIDGATESTVTVSVGSSPEALAVNTVTNKVYVANHMNATVTIIDGATNASATVSVGALPQYLAVNQATNKIYVANSGDNTVTVIDGATNATTSIAAGTNPSFVAVNAETNKIYVANYGSANVTVIDGATNVTSSVVTGQGPVSVAVNSGTNKIYVANSLDADVTVIDGATNSTSTVNAGATPDAVAVDPIANKIYVANKDSNNLTVIDGATNRTATVTVGSTPEFVTVSPATGSLYIANRNGGNVTVIDGATGVTSTVTTGKSPVAVAVNAVTGQFYVANFDSNDVTVSGTAVTQSARVSTAASVQGGFSLSASSPTANAVLPTTYISYGDSITYGSGASSTATQYTNLLAADLAAALTNRGVGGRQACDVAQIIMAHDNPPAALAPLQTLMVGTNDGYWSGTGAYEAVYKECHSASLAWLAIPSTQKTPAQACTQTGSWQPDNTYVAGIAAQSYSPGAALSCPVTSYGGPIYLWYRVTDGNKGAFLYSVDGGPTQSANSYSNPPISTWSGGIDGVFLIRLPGFAAGSHTVQVTVTAASVSILAVGSLSPAMQIGAPEVFAGGVIRYQDDNAAATSEAYDADAAADVTLLSGDGLPVYFVPVRNFVNAYGDMFDGFHPNDSGHLHLRDAYESLSQFPLNSAASFSSTVTVTPANGFNSPVTLAASGWPSGITATFGTNPASKSSTVNISVAATVAPGPYVLTVSGTGGGASANTTIPITVAAHPSFTLSATAASATAASPGTSTVTVTPVNGFVPAVEVTPSGWPAGITATFSKNPTTTSSTATISVTASVAPGLYNLAVKGSVGIFSATTNIALTVTAVNGLSSSATFTAMDTSTQGTWTGTYGGDGYVIAAGPNHLPGYAAVTPGSNTTTYTWAGSTGDVRAVQTSSGSSARIASTYLTSGTGNLTFTVNLNDGGTHQVAIYLLDWDSNSRLQTVSITDSLTGIILDSRTFFQFNSGVYGVWNVKGNVTVNVIANGPGAPIASAIFFGPSGVAGGTVGISLPPPTMSNVNVTNITTTTATINWSTDQASNSSVTYGTSSTTPDSNYVTAHSVTLTNLTPGTTYNFTVVSSNAAALTTRSSSSTFTTAANVSNANPPYVGYVAAWGINSSGATVTWSTDVPADTQLNYGTTPQLGTLTPDQPALTSSHGVVLTGLASGTTYYYVAQSKGANGATGYSTTYSFTTSGAPNTVIPTPTPTPVLTAPVITSVVVTNITSSGAVITWTTDQASTSVVNYGGQTVSSSALITSHSLSLSGLTPNTQYTFAVTSVSAGGLSTTSTATTFTTSSQVATPPNVGYVAFWGITTSGITISWSTDMPADTQVNYGATPNLGTLSPDQPALSNSHGVVLTGLASGTTYYFVAQSKGTNGATGYSTTYSFTTLGSPSTVAAGPVISNIQTSENSNLATINWTTDQASTSVVRYGTQTVSVSTLTTNHSVVLIGLTPGTQYSFTVTSVNASGVSTTSGSSTFTTSAVSGNAPQIGYVAFWGVTSSGVTVSWSTNVPSNTAINYGTTTSLGTLSPVQTALTNSHGVVLAGLQAGTTYYFQAQSTDANGNTGYGTIYTFMTGN